MFTSDGADVHPLLGVTVHSWGMSLHKLSDLRAGDLMIFLSVARCQSVSGAARELNMPASQVSKAVSRLEDQLGLQLMVRSTRGDKRTGRTFSFFGAKGGAGTTTLAVNTAIELARSSHKPTLIVDLHQYLGEVSIFLGEAPIADIVATRPLRCLVLAGPRVEAFLVEHPRVMYRMLQAQARRLRAANRWRS